MIAAVACNRPSGNDSESESSDGEDSTGEGSCNADESCLILENVPELCAGTGGNWDGRALQASRLTIRLPGQSLTLPEGQDRLSSGDELDFSPLDVEFSARNPDGAVATMVLDAGRVAIARNEGDGFNSMDGWSALDYREGIFMDGDPWELRIHIAEDELVEPRFVFGDGTSAWQLQEVALRCLPGNSVSERCRFSFFPCAADWAVRRRWQVGFEGGEVELVVTHFPAPPSDGSERDGAVATFATGNVDGMPFQVESTFRLLYAPVDATPEHGAASFWVLFEEPMNGACGVGFENILQPPEDADIFPHLAYVMDCAFQPLEYRTILSENAEWE